jgi:hypothetical protein
MFTPKQYRAKAVEYGELGKISAGSNKRREFQKLVQKTPTIHASSGFIWGIPVNSRVAHRNRKYPTS